MLVTAQNRFSQSLDVYLKSLQLFFRQIMLLALSVSTGYIVDAYILYDIPPLLHESGFSHFKTIPSVVYDIFPLQGGDGGMLSCHVIGGTAAGEE